MRAIRIEIEQNLVSYLYKYGGNLETLLMPPYSTVIGMVHKACGFTSYHPMDVSVQGNFSNIVDDLRTSYYFNGCYSYEKGRHNMFVESNNKKIGITKATKDVKLVEHVELLIHIVPSVEEIDEIYEHLLHPNIYLSLGRHEDLVDIKRIDFVDIQEKNNVELKNNIYMPLSIAIKEGFNGTVFKLTKNYELVKSEKGIIDRVFNRVECIIASKGSVVQKCYVDKDGFAVFLV